jgi:DNA-binding MarR family transcriptional regulator
MSGHTSRASWQYVRECPEMGATDRLVLLALSDRENQDTRQLNPSIDRLARDCGMGDATVKRAIGRLEARGVIVVTRRRGACSSYPCLSG